MKYEKEKYCDCGRKIRNNVCTNGHPQPYEITLGKPVLNMYERFVQFLINIGKKNKWLATKKLSDTYHTIDELYHHRMILSSVIFNQNKQSAWKSWKHHDGTMFDGMFIVGVETEYGQYSYHYNKEWWYLFEVDEVEFAPEYDGHMPHDIARLYYIKGE